MDTVNRRYRIHHGLTGVCLGLVCLFGSNSDDETVRELAQVGLGLSAALIEDDKEEIFRWIPDLLG